MHALIKAVEDQNAIVKAERQKLYAARDAAVAELTPHKVGDIIEHKFNRSTQARVESISYNEGWSGQHQVRLVLRPFNMDGSPSKATTTDFRPLKKTV